MYTSTATRHVAAALFSALAALATLPTAQAAPVPGQGTWQSTLQARDLDGNGQTDAFYDSVLNITWLRDANASRAADVNNFEQYCAGCGGLMTWNQANTWANNFSFGNYTDWRLPTMVDTGAPGGDLTLPTPAFTRVAQILGTTC